MAKGKNMFEKFENKKCLHWGAALPSLACAAFLSVAGALWVHGQNQPGEWDKDGQNPDDLKVASLLPAGGSGVEVDDGDNREHTKAFVFPVTTGGVATVVATPDRNIQEADLPAEWTLTGGTGTGKLSRTVSLAAPGKFVLNCTCGDSEKETTIYVVRMTFVNPSGDPELSPSDNNEFVFSSASPGVLTINLSVQVTPAEAAGKIKDFCAFSVGDIIGSTLSWNAANPNGRPTASTDGKLAATVTFTGLPSLNSSFGKKRAEITCTLSPDVHFGVLQDYEVFYPRDATNHPSNNSNSNWKNWYYYWMQNAPSLNFTINQTSININVVYSTAATNLWGKATGMYDWSYSTVPQKNEIVIYANNLPRSDRAYSVGNENSGIDHFYNLLRHEKEHVKQIYICDALIASEANTCFQYGWSFKQTKQNHWAC